MTDPRPAPGEPQQPDAPQPHLEAVTALQNACRRMLEYAATRTTVADDVLERATRLLRVPPEQISEADEVALRRLHQELAASIGPATVESIRIIRELEVDRRTRPRLLRKWWNDAEARKQIGFATMLLLIILGVLVVVQVYTLVLSTAVQRINQISEERAAIAKQIEDAQVSAVAAGRTWVMPDTLKERKQATDLRYQGAYRLLAEWARPWSWLVEGDYSVEEDPDHARAVGTHAIRQTAEAVLRALALYVLPLIYGLLGANAYILRAISRQIDQYSFSLLSLYKYRLRLALGALLGASVSLIFSSDEAATKGIGLSMPAVAFLSGYSVEFAFSIVDALINRGRMAVSGNSPPEPPAAKAAPPPR